MLLPRVTAALTLLVFTISVTAIPIMSGSTDPDEIAREIRAMRQPFEDEVDMNYEECMQKKFGAERLDRGDYTDEDVDRESDVCIEESSVGVRHPYIGWVYPSEGKKAQVKASIKQRSQKKTDGPGQINLMDLGNRAVGKLQNFGMKVDRVMNTAGKVNTDPIRGGVRPVVQPYPGMRFKPW